MLTEYILQVIEYVFCENVIIGSYFVLIKKLLKPVLVNKNWFKKLIFFLINYNLRGFIVFCHFDCINNLFF